MWPTKQHGGMFVETVRLISTQNLKPTGPAFLHMQRTARLERVKRTLSEPVDISSLVFFRVVFGIIMLFHVVHEFRSGNIEHVWVLPEIHFAYPGFDWLPIVPGQWYYLLFGILLVCSILITLGLLYRAATIFFFVTWSYIFLSEASAFQNHFYLLCLISGMMMCLPAHRSFSLDVYFNRVSRLEKTPFWTIFLVRMQFAIVYFFGGIAKLNADWLAGHPIDIWLERRSEYFLIGPFTKEPWLIFFIAWGGLILDLLAAPLLFWKRTRLHAYLVTLGFHLTNNWLFNIGIFPWFMAFGTLIFFKPDWPRRYQKWVAIGPFKRIFSSHRGAETSSKLANRKKKKKHETPPAVSSVATIKPLGKWGFVALGTYLFIQLLLPLRPHFYPGNTSWTEEGHFFSWRMMLQDKRIVSQSIQLINTQTNEAQVVVLKDYFEYWQAENMLQTPELIRQFAEYLVEENHSYNTEDLEVKVDVMVSLNGREPQRLIDPNVNLAEVENDLGPAEWIVPLTTPLPY